MRRDLIVPVVVLALVACEDSRTPAGPNPDTGPVHIDDSAGPIFRSLEVKLESAAAIEVEYWTAGATRLRVASLRDAAEHRVFLPRLRSGALYEYEIRRVGSTDEDPLFDGRFETGPLPAALAAIRVEASGTATFPLTMVEVVFPTWQQWIVDADGEIVWYRPERDPEANPGVYPRSTGFTRLANGDFVFNEFEFLSVVTPDLREVGRLDRTAEMGRMHHDVITTPRNTVLFLAREDRDVDGTTWRGEAIWEWDPATGALAQRWSAFDDLDPAVDRGARSVPDDWLHANSLAIGPRGNVLVSLFWLHEVLSIEPDYNGLEWRLGGPKSTFTVADGAMDAGQHTAAEVSPGRILLFDNGLDRPDGNYSRASEIALDHEAGTAEIVWQFRPSPDIYAALMSSARRLENGNTVVAFGWGSAPIEIFEVTPSSQVVWSLHVSGVTAVYRATPLTHVGGEEELP